MRITLEGTTLPEDKTVDGVEFLTDNDKVYIQVENYYVQVSKDDLLRVLRALE